MKISLFLLIFITALLVCQAESSILAPLTKQLSSWMKWKISATSVPQTDVSVVQFENGYFVETVVEGNKLGVVPHAIRVSPDGELFAVDAINSNIVRITPPLSQYSRARLVAGSFEGYSGHVDGKPSDARFNHPKGVTMDDKGNVYVADTINMAIRKIGDAGVTTIAGGKSNIPGYRDGPSEDAKFSSDFDVIYVSSTCSLLVVDRGNAALRQISLHQEDCDHNYSSISSSDFILVIGAVLVGYASGLLQHGPFLSFTKNQTDKIKEIQNQPNEEKAPLLVEMLKEDPDAGWPSFGTLILDLLKFSFEALCAFFFNLLPRSLRPSSSNKNLTPLKDHLIMPEDKPEPPLVHKQRVSAPLNETFHAPNSSSSYAEQKIMQNKTSLFKDTSVSSKHRSSKRTDYAAFYGSSENQYSQPTSKVMKDKTRHRYRDKSGEAVLGGGVTRMEAKPAEIKPVDYSDPKFDHYNIRSKYSDDGVFRY